MISQTDKQLLFSLKMNTDFIYYLQSMNLCINDYDIALQEVFVEASPLCGFFINKAEQMYYNLMPSLYVESQASLDSGNATCLNRLENCSETDDSACSFFEKKQSIVFNVKKMKTNKYIKFRNSQRSNSIIRKVKTLFHKFVISNLNSLLHQASVSTFLRPLPKKLSINSNLIENKKLSEMSIRELIVSDNAALLHSNSTNQQHNMKVLKSPKVEKSDIVEAYLSKKWKTAFEEFLHSPLLLSAIRETEFISKRYAESFRKYSWSFLQFMEH